MKKAGDVFVPGVLTGIAAEFDRGGKMTWQYIEKSKPNIADIWLCYFREDYYAIRPTDDEGNFDLEENDGELLCWRSLPYAPVSHNEPDQDHNAITRFLVNECLLVEPKSEGVKMLERAGFSLACPNDLRIAREEGVLSEVAALLGVVLNEN